MKKILLLLLAGTILTSCALETYQCHSYGNTNHVTKHGHKAQSKYYKRKI